jgi:hypothetical protein
MRAAEFSTICSTIWTLRRKWRLVGGDRVCLFQPSRLMSLHSFRRVMFCSVLCMAVFLAPQNWAGPLRNSTPTLQESQTVRSALNAISKSTKGKIIVELINPQSRAKLFENSKRSAPLSDLERLTLEQTGKGVKVDGSVMSIHDPEIEMRIGYDPLSIKVSALSVRGKNVPETLAALTKQTGVLIFPAFQSHAMHNASINLELTNTTLRYALLRILEATGMNYIHVCYDIDQDAPSKYMILIATTNAKLD